MSQVSNLMVTFGALEPSSRIEDINVYFDKMGYGRGLVSIEDPKLPVGWYGGNKPIECEVLIGAFNFLDGDGFIDHLRTIPWTDRESVQVFLQEQDSKRFGVTTL